MFFNLHKLYKAMHIEKKDILRAIRLDLNGLGADKCNFYEKYRDHLDTCFKDYTQYIRR